MGGKAFGHSSSSMPWAVRRRPYSPRPIAPRRPTSDKLIVGGLRTTRTRTGRCGLATDIFHVGWLHLRRPLLHLRRPLLHRRRLLQTVHCRGLPTAEGARCSSQPPVTRTFTTDASAQSCVARLHKCKLQSVFTRATHAREHTTTAQERTARGAAHMIVLQLNLGWNTYIHRILTAAARWAVAYVRNKVHNNGALSSLVSDS